MDPLFVQKRKSFIEMGKIYFYSATINSWINLLNQDMYKEVIVDSLQHLTDQGKIQVFAFVIMPTHIHLIWRIVKPNGKENTHGSFLKYTAHQFKNLLLTHAPTRLPSFKVKAANKNYEFWIRDPLAVHLFSPDVAFQKLNYIHANPVSKKWALALEPSDYKYSSASFYERDETQFAFLKDLRVEF